MQGHAGDTKGPMPAARQDDHVASRRQLGVLAAVTDQRFVVTRPARPGRIAVPEIQRYNRMMSPPLSAVPDQLNH